jgi:hypothetical protein
MKGKRLLTEVLMYATLITRAVQLSDEIKHLYKIHKPKGHIGFVRPERKRWFKR